MPTVSFAQLGIWVVCALIALDVFLRVSAHLREKQVAADGTTVKLAPPVVVTAQREYATSAELAKVERELKSDLTKGAASRKEMHKEIEVLRVGLARMEEQNSAQTRQLHLLDSKIDRILERMPRHSS